jgi:hypothetical protein
VQAAEKHVDNIETILEGLKKDSLHSKRRFFSFRNVRSIILGLGLGGGAAGVLLFGGAGGLLGLLSCYYDKSSRQIFKFT